MSSNHVLGKTVILWNLQKRENGGSSKCLRQYYRMRYVMAVAGRDSHCPRRKRKCNHFTMFLLRVIEVACIKIKIDVYQSRDSTQIPVSRDDVQTAASAALELGYSRVRRKCNTCYVHVCFGTEVMIHAARGKPCVESYDVNVRDPETSSYSAYVFVRHTSLVSDATRLILGGGLDHHSTVARSDCHWRGVIASMRSEQR